jgi:hypothetical protein
MSDLAAVPAPSEVKWGLRLAWLALLISVLTAMYGQLSSALPAGSNVVSSPLTLLVPVMLLFTPSFLGFWLTAVALVFLARRKGWIRWILLIGTVAGVCLFIFTVVNGRASGSPLGTTPFVIIRATVLCVYALSVALLFMRTSNTWFGGHSNEAL